MSATSMKPKKKIAIVLNTAWNIYNFRLGLIKALQHNGSEVIAIAPPDEYTAKIIAATNCKFIPLTSLKRKGTNPLQDLKLIGELYRIYRQEKIDIVLQYTIKPVIYGTIAAYYAKVVSINTITGLGYTFLSDGWVNKIAQQMYRFALRRADKVLFQNQDDLQLFLDKKIVKAEKCGIVHGSGVNTSHFSPTDSVPLQPFAL